SVSTANSSTSIMDTADESTWNQSYFPAIPRTPSTIMYTIPAIRSGVIASSGERYIAINRMKMSTTVAIIKTKSPSLNKPNVSEAIPAGPVISNSTPGKSNSSTLLLISSNASLVRSDEISFFIAMLIKSVEPSSENISSWSSSGNSWNCKLLATSSVLSSESNHFVSLLISSLSSFLNSLSLWKTSSPVSPSSDGNSSSFKSAAISDGLSPLILASSLNPS